jgi:hypothetical protein
MSTPITEYVSVSVAVADRLVQAIDFGVPAIYDVFTLPASWATGQRSKSYATLAAVAVDFATTTKVYKAAQAVFTADSAYPAPSTVKVLREDSGDANITAALDAIELLDPDWYALVAANRAEADILEIAAWIAAATNPHVYFACSEDAGVIDSGTTDDVLSDLQTLAYGRIGYMWHQNGGVDTTGTAIAVSSLVATVTEASHGLRVGDEVTVSGATPTELNGNVVVATVPTDGTWTYVTTATDGSATGTIDYFARYKFPEARMVGMGIPTVAGKITWFGKVLVGQTPTTTDLLNLTQQRTVKSKGGNIYTSIGGLGAVQTGQMVSGRFIDTQIGIDWIAVRLAEQINQRLLSTAKVPYTDAGIAVLRADITSVLQRGQVNGLLADRLTNDTQGRAWIIEIPALDDISLENRAARILPDVTVTVRFAGAVHNVVIAVNVGL